MGDYRKIMQDSYRTIGYASANPDNKKAREERIKQYRFLINKLLPQNKESRILDAGCGSGFFLEFLICEGYKNIIGVDVSHEQVECARKKNLPVIEGDTIDFLKNNKNFDAIIAFDLIEHLTKDEIIDFLFASRKSLKPGGFIILKTGNASSIYGLTMRYVAFDHEIGFTEESLRQVLLACGFSDISIDDTKIPLCWKPKGFIRWAMSKILRVFLKTAYMIEVGTDRPSLFGKLLIAKAIRGKS